MSLWWCDWLQMFFFLYSTNKNIGLISKVEETADGEFWSFCHKKCGMIVYGDLNIQKWAYWFIKAKQSMSLPNPLKWSSSLSHPNDNNTVIIFWSGKKCSLLMINSYLQQHDSNGYGWLRNKKVNWLKHPDSRFITKWTFVLACLWQLNEICMFLVYRNWLVMNIMSYCFRSWCQEMLSKPSSCALKGNLLLSLGCSCRIKLFILFSHDSTFLACSNPGWRSLFICLVSHSSINLNVFWSFVFNAITWVQRRDPKSVASGLF